MLLKITSNKFGGQYYMKKIRAIYKDGKREIKRNMSYYNHYRGQWNLKKATACEIQTAASTSCLGFFKMSFTKGTLYERKVLFFMC